MSRMIKVGIIAALALAACGGEEQNVASGEATSATTVTTEAPTTTDATLASTATTAAPATTVDSAATTAAEMTADELAITEAYAVAFSSETSFEDTLPYLVEPDGMEEVVSGYADIGGQMGGVSVEIESIAVSGSEATVTYTLLFGGNPTYSGLTGSAILTDAGWQLTREMFCGLMTSARVGCPTA